MSIQDSISWLGKGKGRMYTPSCASFVSTGSRFAGILTVLLVLTLAGIPANAQVLSGTLTGSVVDSTDAVVPNAKGLGKGLETGKEDSAVTDAPDALPRTNLPNRD